MGDPPESETLEREQLEEILNSLPGIQREIVELKTDGYSNREIYLALRIKPSTYYGKVQQIRETLKRILGNDIY